MKPGKNSIFLKKGKMIIFVIVQVGNLEIFQISDDEMDFTVEIFSQNLVT